MAWMLLVAAWWFNGMTPRPTRRQINQERTVSELAALVRAAEKTGMAFAILPGKEYDDVLNNPCRRPRTRQK